MTPAEYSQLESISRRSLRMYPLTDREKMIADVIIDFSFKRGRESAVIPRLQMFVDLTGIDKGDISKALQRLEDRGIIVRSGLDNERVYAFIPSARFWIERAPRYDVEQAIATERELERINAMPAGYEPTGQATWLPAAEPGLNDGIAAAARDDALSADSVGESPIGESPTAGGVGVSPTVPSLYSRAGDVKNVTVHNVMHNVAVGDSPTVRSRTGDKKRSFADSERQHIFEQLEDLAAGPDFDLYRPKWICRVRDFPNIVREAVGDVRLWKTNPKNKLRKSAGAMIFQRAKLLAQAAGKTFHLW